MGRVNDHRKEQEPALTSDRQRDPGIDQACAGKAFEHHERTDVVDGSYLGRWWCPECGTSDTFDAVFKTMASLMPLMHRLNEQFFRPEIVFLIPSDATPSCLGEFYGCEVYRVGGIPAPMIAMPGLQVSRT